MAITVYDVEEIELQNGTSVKLKPLTINKLKVFMEKMNNLGNLETEIDTINYLTEVCAFILEPQIEGLKDNKELAGDLFDLPTIKRVIKVCGGIDLDDPNLIAAAQAAAGLI